jgi:acyl transferase domain-containing protein/NAD(P)-dependent dehydrogenase (short-subunit alcohol dehydrogenase family)/acyl carrier protein
MSEHSDTSPAREPIAIIGIGCRFPGAADVSSFWRLLHDGTDAIGEYPGGRFQYIDRVFAADLAHGGRIASRRGGFLPDLDRLDAGFFGISPREATLLDPQQRLLLEVAWEAIEDAGLVKERLAGSRSGVFIGMWVGDFETCLYEACPEIDLYSNTGAGRYPAPGRLAYFLDLRGPSLTVDTACSSSLVAVHLACQSLRAGESEMALAGGVNVILRPEVNLTFSAAGMLSPDGSCKFGDSSADGYVRSEGAGVVVLKRMSSAIADGDPIYAVIRGSAVNTGGRSSGILVRPSRDGQAQVIREALRDAQATPADIDYVEAHGTGTPAGDRVEIEAIGRVIAEAARTRPCALGSVKTNIGHTEAASGVAGIIKTALALEHLTIPASLHFHEATGLVDWNQLPIHMQTLTAPWPPSEAPLAGVSGFGLTGTNAHAILQRFVAPQVIDSEEPTVELFTLSAGSPEALAALATRWRDRLEADATWPAYLRDLAFTAAARRTHHEHRLAIAARDRGELLQKLSAWLAKESAAGVLSGGNRLSGKTRAVFVFPGQGGQWLGMGRGLYEREPVFRKALEECDEAVRRHTGWSLIERLTSSKTESLDQIDVVQPCLFGVMVALAALWRSWGVEPEAVVGHSMGEAAAAAVSGALSLDDAAAAICHRSRLMKGASGRGLMAVAELSLEEATALTADHAGRISVAASNSPTSTVLSGDAEVIEEVLAELERREIFCRRIKVDIASHSAHMDPFREELVRALEGIQPRAGAIPLYSATTGAIEPGTGLQPEYWGRNLRQPVLFWPAVRNLLQDGFNVFLEMNAHPILLQSLEDGIRYAGNNALAVASLRRDKDERTELLSALGELYVGGYSIDFQGLYPKGNCLRLPTYAWQRERYWPEERLGRGGSPFANSRLGKHVESSLDPGTHFWEIELPDETGSAISLAAACITAAQAAIAEVFRETELNLENLAFPAGFAGRPAVTGQMAIAAGTPYGRQMTISVLDDAGWKVRTTGTIRPRTGNAAELQGVPRTLEGGLSNPLEECLKFALETSVEKPLDGGWAVTRIDRARLWRAFPKDTLVMRAALLPGECAAVDCRVDLQDGTPVVEFTGIHFEPAGAQDAARHMYELEWRPDPTERLAHEMGNWVVLCGDHDLARKISEVFARAGLASETVQNPEALREVVAARDCQGILQVCDEKAYDAVRVVQMLSGLNRPQPSRLWLATRGACALAGDTAELAVQQGVVSGLARVISREHPEFQCATIDLPAEPGAGDILKLVEILCADGPEEQIAVRDGRALVARYARLASVSFPELRFSDNATYLITGGLGGIGLKVASWMAGHGARHFALMGRRPASAGAVTQIAELEKLGAEVRVFLGDVADRDRLARILREIAETMPPLKGIHHAAAVLEDALLIDTTEAAWNRVMAPKADGAWHLHQLTVEVPLDFFVLFSSVAAVASQPGQGAYAAANAFLNSLASERQRMGLPATSVEWGAWANTGFAVTDGKRRNARDYMERGMATLPLTMALDGLGRAITLGKPCLLVVPVRWDKFAEAYGTEVPMPFSALTAVKPPAKRPDDLVERLRAASGRERRAILLEHIERQLAQSLKLSSMHCDPEKPFGFLGVDSLIALDLVRRVSASANIRLPATAVFNYCTLTALTAEVARRMDLALDGVGEPRVPGEVDAAANGALHDIRQIDEEDAIAALMRGDGA